MLTGGIQIKMSVFQYDFHNEFRLKLVLPQVLLYNLVLNIYLLKIPGVC